MNFVSRRRLAITIGAFTALMLGGGAALGLWLGWSGHMVKAETVRDYALEEATEEATDVEDMSSVFEAVITRAMDAGRQVIHTGEE